MVTLDSGGQIAAAGDGAGAGAAMAGGVAEEAAAPEEGAGFCDETSALKATTTPSTAIMAPSNPTII